MVSCQPSLLSPTAETYVYPLVKPPASTPISISVPPAAEPPVATPPAFDDSNVPIAVAKSSALPIAVLYEVYLYERTVHTFTPYIALNSLIERPRSLVREIYGSLISPIRVTITFVYLPFGD